MPIHQQYNHYTRCVAPDNYSGPYFGTSGFAWAIVGSIALIFVGIFFDPGLVTIGAISIGLAYCHWWLYGRLVCLGGNKCLIGLVVDIDTQQDQGGGFGQLDTDVSLNLLLAPDLFRGTSDPNWAVNASVNNPIQGEIIGTTLASLGFTEYPFPLPGEPVTGATINEHDGFQLLSPAEATALDLPNPDAWHTGIAYNVGDKVLDSNHNVQQCTYTPPDVVSGPNPPTWATLPGQFTFDGPEGLMQWYCDGPLCLPTVEVEFEGAGVWELYRALQIAMGFAGAGTVIGALKWLGPVVAALCAIPIIGWIICAIAAAAVAIAAALAAASFIAAVYGLYKGGKDTSAEAEVKKCRPRSGGDGLYEMA
jgi:hypothetical protein